MITELKLENWKSFRDATLYIDPVTILIGTNASGKSNTLDALLFLQRVASGVGIYPAIQGDVNLPPIRGGVDWVCSKSTREFSLEITLNTEDKNIEYRYELSVQVNGLKAEVSREELTLLKYGPRSQIPKKIRCIIPSLRKAQPLGFLHIFRLALKGMENELMLAVHTLY